MWQERARKIPVNCSGRRSPSKSGGLRGPVVNFAPRGAVPLLNASTYSAESGSTFQPARFSECGFARSMAWRLKVLAGIPTAHIFGGSSLSHSAMPERWASVPFARNTCQARRCGDYRKVVPLPNQQREWIWLFTRLFSIRILSPLIWQVDRRKSFAKRGC
jgi:hypothetical protein